MALVEDFVAHELSIAGKNEQAARGKESAAAQVQTLKYWVALSARSESIFKKVHFLLAISIFDLNVDDLVPRIIAGCGACSCC